MPFRTIAAALYLILTITPALAAEDAFLWLEDTQNGRTEAWVKQQNERSTDLLKKDPRFASMYKEAADILQAKDRIPLGTLQGGYVYNLWQDDEHQRGLWRRAKLESYTGEKPDWEILIDIDALSKAENEKWVFKKADCLEPEYKRCLISLSRGGGDAVVVREFDIASKNFVANGFAVPEAKTILYWADPNTVFIASDFGKDSLTSSGYPRIVKLWKRGTPMAQAVTVAESAVSDYRISPFVSVTKEGRILFAVRRPGFFSEETSRIALDGTVHKLPLPLSTVFQGVLNGQAVVSLREPLKAKQTNGHKITIPQGALFAFPLEAALQSGKLPPVSVLYKPGPRDALNEDSIIGGKAVYAVIMDNVRGRLREFTFANATWASRDIPVPDNGAVSIDMTDSLSGDVMVSYESFTVPTTLSYASGPGQDFKPIKNLPPRFDASDAVTEQLEARSRDGTKIPYFFVHKSGAKGPLPVLIYGYGGFEVSLTPWYWATTGKLWLSRGGAYVVANIRGGGEFGPAWHKAALGVNRQKAYDDFIAVAEDLIARKITTPKHLGIMGGSNGGLLVGAVLMQRPDLYNAVVCDSPLLDMLRYTKLPPGASWMAEYGDPDKPQARAAIAKYSPYQNVKDGIHYPRIFFTTARTDDRVNPAHARKMAALMQSKGYDALFFEQIEGGHGSGSTPEQKAESYALKFVYLTQQLMDETDKQAPVQ